MGKKKRKKKNRIKYKIFWVILLIVVVSATLYIAPNYIQKSGKGAIELVIRDEQIRLQKELYISDKGVIYLSKEDIKSLFDKNIYDEEDDYVITTYQTKVAAISKNENKMRLNGTQVDLLETTKQINDTIYLPLSEMKDVYNIEIEYVKDSNTVVIDYLQKELAVANSKINGEVRYKPTLLSKTVDTVTIGEKVFYIEKAEKDWVKVRTTRGKVGYLKESDITNLIYIRQSMENTVANSNTSYNIKDILVKDLNKRQMETYIEREKIAETLVSQVVMDGVNAVNINLEQINQDSRNVFKIYNRISTKTKGNWYKDIYHK